MGDDLGVRRVSMKKCGVLAVAMVFAVVTPRLCLAQQYKE
jgi:hypothetical protein